jgi:hypothetical protein
MRVVASSARAEAVFVSFPYVRLGNCPPSRGTGHPSRLVARRPVWGICRVPHGESGRFLLRQPQTSPLAAADQCSRVREYNSESHHRLFANL